MKTVNGFQFVLGVIVGAVIFGGSVAYAAGVVAQPKTADVVIDGIAVELRGYIIEGSHYFQLRDLDEKLVPGGKDFSIVWDGQNNRIFIDTSRGYDPDEKLPAPNTAAPQQNDWKYEYALEVVRLTNLEREKAGLPPLILADNLMELATVKAQDMADNRYLGHDSPTFGMTKDLLDRSLWRKWMGENLARGSRTPEAVVNGWMRSDGHRANILKADTTHIGVGVAEDYAGILLWAQVFAIAK
jgi:hypothetical protein